MAMLLEIKCLLLLEAFNSTEFNLKLPGLDLRKLQLLARLKSMWLLLQDGALEIKLLLRLLTLVASSSNKSQLVLLVEIKSPSLQL